MANVTVFVEAGTTVDVKPGAPPVDQSAEVASLTQANAALTQQVSSLTTSNASKQKKLDDLLVLANAQTAADAASVDGQAARDIINAP